MKVEDIQVKVKDRYLEDGVSTRLQRDLDEIEFSDGLNT